ncbi:dTDP-4-dehydrorhamnose reductase (plasmid) [Solidesulfovibrio carbinoliphilus subsp. oakridgensis]|uniref:dTDP-4-dehydrorhamnose reductase n=1 Tax=Solidesulfovibrio carbinoliphilus subsp. oakridgensis TaxID=694327 RepID=G7QE68_9BACT|nr:SDR family oxidoreductase [Solidesulfovibrio carbinoliphilus]EHJ45962.1 dTDP-4-dehydrorhamnose reductase [Solidesulfovibrio carbinoliphilus subsp. oakridgensis]
MAARRRLLVTGASGLLGGNVALALCRDWEVVGTYAAHPFSLAGTVSRRLDIRSDGEVAALFADIRPEVTVHCAAETRVDACEARPDEAFAVNARAPGRLARAARAAGSLFVHVSTDAVYAPGGAPHAESAPTGPVNAYAASKLAGEEAVAEAGGECLIVRTNLFGWSGRAKRSLAEWALARLEAGGEPLTGFTDAVFSPLLASDLARAIEALVRAGARGVYNAGAADAVSKYAFLRLLCREFGYPEDLVRPGRSGQTLAARRPGDTSLDSSRAAALIGTSFFPPVAEAVRRLKKLRDAGVPGLLAGSLGRGPATSGPGGDA